MPLLNRRLFAFNLAETDPGPNRSNRRFRPGLRKAEPPGADLSNLVARLEARQLLSPYSFLEVSSLLLASLCVRCGSFKTRNSKRRGMTAEIAQKRPNPGISGRNAEIRPHRRRAKRRFGPYGSLGSLTFVRTVNCGSKVLIRQGPLTCAKKNRYTFGVLRGPSRDFADRMVLFIMTFKPETPLTGLHAFRSCRGRPRACPCPPKRSDLHPPSPNTFRLPPSHAIMPSHAETAERGIASD